MKKVFSILLVLLMLLALAGCNSKILHCDNCGTEVKVSQSSEMEEDWAIYCEACNKALFGK